MRLVNPGEAPRSVFRPPSMSLNRLAFHTCHAGSSVEASPQAFKWPRWCPELVSRQRRGRACCSSASLLWPILTARLT